VSVSRGEELLTGGDEAHVQAATEYATPHLNRVAIALDLLANVVEQITFAPGQAFANDLGALACLTRCCRDVRASALLAMNGYHTQARALLRCAYEAAGLARVIAKEPELADKWLTKGEWVPDRDVRRFIEEQVLEEGQPSPYRDYYRLSSAWVHPTARSTVPQVVSATGGVRASLSTQHNRQETETILREIAAEAVFACFAMKRALAGEDVLAPEWHRQLALLAEEVTGEELVHLRQNWAQADLRFEAFQASIISADQLDEFLTQHPNSVDNIRRRAQGSAPEADS
jgi:hypothetical protein